MSVESSAAFQFRPDFLFLFPLKTVDRFIDSADSTAASSSDREVKDHSRVNKLNLNNFD